MPSLIDRLRTLFTRRPPPLTPDQAEGWEPGDMAECLFEGPWHNCYGLVGVGPVPGEIRIVERIEVRPHRQSGELAAFLVFARYAPASFEAVCFRRPRPRADLAVPAVAAWLDHVRKPEHPLESEMS